jgi:hypothetical protein
MRPSHLFYCNIHVSLTNFISIVRPRAIVSAAEGEYYLLINWLPIQRLTNMKWNLHNPLSPLFCVWNLLTYDVWIPTVHSNCFLVFFLFQTLFPESIKMWYKNKYYSRRFLTITYSYTKSGFHNLNCWTGTSDYKMFQNIVITMWLYELPLFGFADRVLD